MKSAVIACLGLAFVVGFVYAAEGKTKGHMKFLNSIHKAVKAHNYKAYWEKIPSLYSEGTIITFICLFWLLNVLVNK